MKTLTVLLVLFVALAPSNPDHYQWQNTFCLMVAAWALCRYVARRVGEAASAMFFIVFLYAIPDLFGARTNFLRFGVDGYWKLTIASHEALMFFLMTTLPVLMLEKKNFRHLVSAFGVFGLVNSLWLLGAWVIGREFVCGAFDASSIDASVIAVLYPLMVFRQRPARWDGNDWASIKKHWPVVTYEAACVVAPPLAIFASGSSTGLGALFVVITAHAFRLGALKKHPKVFTATGVFTAAVGAAVIGPRQLFNDSGRLTMIQEAFVWWSANASEWWGLGLGSFWAAGTTAVKSQPVGWLHNDWAQIIFEMGWPFFIFTVFFYAWLVVRSLRREPWVFACVIGYGFIALLQMPLHHFLSAALGSILVVKALGRDTH